MRTPKAAYRWDISALAVALGLVGLAFWVGARLNERGVPLYAGAAPLYAAWGPHLGIGTPFAIAVAGVVVACGPAAAARLGWRPLLLLAYVIAVAWTISLALIDGWQAGVASRLVNPHEYLHEVPGVTDIPAMLRGFSGRILDFQPHAWTTHVAGHPPGALLVFVWLDRIGLGGGGAAGLVCIAVGCAAAVAVPVTVRAVASTRCPTRASSLARACVPFMVLFPGAVWIGVSADAVFTGVTATGAACLALGAAAGPGRMRRPLWCGVGGALLGFSIYLSYGLLLFGVIAVAVAVVAAPPGQWWRALAAVAPGAIAVIAAFTAAGFWWSDGYQRVVTRYYQGIGAVRPYGYWVWANLACLVLAVGPVIAPSLRRAVARLRRPADSPGLLAVAVVPLAAGLAVALADVSGLSKAETERIWLPFAVWLLVGTALLPPRSRRWWLSGQAVVALLVNHLFVTYW